jgi:N-acetylglucosamine kinase-like BadF-type ATPase
MGTEGLVLGVDGGNTKTIALLARPDGRLLGYGRALGCADIHSVGEDAARPVVKAAITDALAMAQARPAEVVAAWFSMAGADWPEDVTALEGSLRSAWPAARVVNDGLGALRAAIPTGPGVVVAAGTGATTAARGPHDRTWHAGFWQHPQGAGELADQALRAVFGAHLGTEPQTRLVGRLLAATGEPDVKSLLHRATRRGSSLFGAFSWLAPALIDVAAEGDPIARRIVLEHGAGLGRIALAAARAVGIEDDAFAIALVGGLFRHADRALASAVLATVRERAPGAIEVAAAFAPSYGALLLALDDVGTPSDPDVEATLRATLAPETIFETRSIS